jgi:hypothetical protein
MTHPVPRIEVSAHIPAQAEDVLRFVADTRNDPKWCENVETVEMLTPEPVGIGSKFRFHQHLDRPGGGRMQFDVDVEITELEEDSVTWRVEDRFQGRHITISVHPVEGGCRITQVTRAAFKKPPGITKWLYPRLAKRIFTRQFAALADRFQSGTI